MIYLIYNSRFKKLHEFRINDNWMLGNNKSNEIIVFFEQEIVNKRVHPTLALITSNNRHIFPIVGLEIDGINTSIAIKNNIVYNYDVELDKYYTFDSEDNIHYINLCDADAIYQNGFKFTLSTANKTIVSEGSMTIQIVMNMPSNTDSVTFTPRSDTTYQKTIDSIVVNVKKGYWDTPTVLVNRDGAVDDLYAIITSTKQAIYDNKERFTNIDNEDTDLTITINNYDVVTLLNPIDNLVVKLPLEFRQGNLAELNFRVADYGVNTEFHIINESEVPFKIVAHSRAIESSVYEYAPNSIGTVFFSHNGREILVFMSEIKV